MVLFAPVENVRVPVKPEALESGVIEAATVPKDVCGAMVKPAVADPVTVAVFER
jgi:hypothetical protein